MKNNQTQEQRELLDTVFRAMRQYLITKGWIYSEDDATLFYALDPITGMHHRNDIAFLIQGERDIVENDRLYKEKYGTNKNI